MSLLLPLHDVPDIAAIENFGVAFLPHEMVAEDLYVCDSCKEIITAGDTFVRYSTVYNGTLIVCEEHTICYDQLWVALNWEFPVSCVLPLGE